MAMANGIILASGSATRQQMLANAGVSFDVVVPRVDETAILQSLLAENAKPADIAGTLAEYKGRRVAGTAPDALVIAADQVLVCNGKVYCKPQTMDQARDQLIELRGNGHQLLSAVVAFEGGQPVWRFVGRAQLQMRDFSARFLDSYLQSNGSDILSSVGCYKLETTGVLLFSHVQGDYFTILGLPLLEVLGFLRTRGVLSE